MSTYKSIKVINLPCGENLNGKLYHALTYNNAGQLIMADAATDDVVAVLAEDPGRATVAGDMVAVHDLSAGGVGLVIAAGAIAAGSVLVASAEANEGKASSVADIGALGSDQAGFGYALEAAGAADEVIRFHAKVVAAPHSI